ncbi:MAG: hypothetical protein RLZZ214_312 [Verrucomicrobiota bacterium]
MTSQNPPSDGEKSIKPVNHLSSSVSEILKILERYGKTTGPRAATFPTNSTPPKPSAAPLPRYPPLTLVVDETSE